MIPTTLLALRRRIHRAQGDGESGFAMVVVLGMATVMTALLGGALLYATSESQGGSTDDVNYSIAYNAAVAGVNDFTARMNTDKTYCTKLQALGDQDPANDATTKWQKVQGTANSFYHYKRLTSCAISGGDTSDIKIEVTGIAGPKTGPTLPEVRTITAEIKRPGFRDYVFFTDKEEGDPYLKEYAGDISDPSKCTVYEWKLPSSQNNRPSNCEDLSFLTGDTLNGKVHTNDIIRTSGNPSFEAQVSEGCPGTLSGQPCYSTAGSTNTGRFINASGTPDWNGFTIQTGVTLQMPDDDQSVRDAAEDPVKPGCVYMGPTRIVLLNTGRMSVASRGGSTTPATCPVGANVALPGNGVVFVRSLVPGDAGYSSSCPDAPWVVSPTPSGIANTGGTSYPLKDDSDVNSTPALQTCNDGNLWIEGTLDGIADIGTEKNIYITGDIKYKDGLTGSGANDGLGLVAQNSIVFYHPVGKPSTTTTTTIPAHCERVLERYGSPETTAETTKAHCTGTKMKFTSTSPSNIKNTTNATCTSTNTNTSSNSYCDVGDWIDVSTTTNTTYGATDELCASTCGKNLSVSAAMLSVSHSIYLPWFSETYTSNLGTLTINGSVAQFYRGPVKSGTHGYSKSYNYDPRLVNIVLPGFPTITSGFGSNQYTEGVNQGVSAPCYGRTGLGTWSTTTSTWSVANGYPAIPNYRTQQADGTAC